MATKTVTISPPLAAAGGCSATCESYASGTTPAGYGGTKSWTNYKCTATAVAEWVFAYWEYTEKWRYYDGSEASETVIRVDNPHPPAELSYTWRFPYESTTDYPSPPIYADGLEVAVKFEVKAVFRLHPQTSLLVNTHNKMPGRQFLVHDPATGLLVVDW